jgi:lipopolysaccharide/colanic/teichoic acid biosynthesis glycosyltransferase
MTGTRTRVYLVAKRILDLAICVALLVVAIPVILVCALAIRLDSPGWVMIAQPRTGRDGRRFRMLKLRTMLANAEELKPQLAHLSVVPPPDFKIPDDPRITRVGRFLRATSLDELPQLWHTQRLEVRPGITGLWQLEGRNVTTFDERLRLDVQYIRRRSLLFDLELIARTVVVVFRRSGA